MPPAAQEASGRDADARAVIVGHARERFHARARALVYARLGLMAIGLAVLMVPAWHQALNIPMPEAAYWYLATLAYHVASQLVVGRPHDRAVLFSTLCLDVLAVLYLVIASGGIRSSLMPTQLVLTVLFALLFPSPLALVPPLLTLPILAKVGQILGTQRLPEDLLLLLWYSALNVTLVYIIVYLDGRERGAFRELLALQGERRRAELADQRIRIAREIHDSVGAALSGVALQAEYLAAQVDEGPIRQEVQELREAATDGMEELRRAVSMLHRDFSLSSAVPDYVAQAGQRHRLGAECEVAGVEGELSPDRQLALFRILQESLTNVGRHAQATVVTVKLRFSAEAVSLEIVDDGRGFDPDHGAEGHYGLRNMRERATRIGGTLDLRSRSGAGTQISVTIPRDDQGGQGVIGGFTSPPAPS